MSTPGHSPQPPHPQQYAPQQYAPQQPPQKVKKPLWKRWWFWVLAVVALIILGSAMGGGDDDTEATAASEEAGSATQEDASASDGSADDAEAEGDSAAEYAIGDTVASGDWEVTVHSMEDGVAEVGNEFLSSTAQGQFVLIEIGVKNAGSSPDYFFDNDVSLADADGNTYATDSEAGIYAASDSDLVFLEEINPGNTATGLLVFDVPEDVTPTVLEFKSGIFDDAAVVSLQ